MGRTFAWNGVELVVPGSYSYTDLTRLLTPTSGGVGIVALVGEADGGSPGVHLFDGGTSQSVVKAELKSGPGADAVKFALRAGSDPLVPSGASSVLFVKTNPSTQSTAKVGGLVDPVLATTKFTCVADVGGSLDGLYFILADEDGTVAFWINEGSTPEPVHGADRSVEITTIASGDSAIAVATKVAAAVQADIAFTASVVETNKVLAVNAVAGPVTGQSLGTSTFTDLVLTAGVAADTVPIVTLRTKQYGLFTASYKASIATASSKIILYVYDEFGNLEKSPALGGTSYATLLTTLGTAATMSLSYESGNLKLKTFVDSVLSLNIDVSNMNLTQVAQEVNSHTGYTMTVVPEYGPVAATDLDLVITPVSIKTNAYGFVASIYELQQWGESQSTLVTIERSAENEGNTLIGQNLSSLSFSGGVRGTTNNSAVQAAINMLLEFRINILVPLFSYDNQDGSSVDILSVNSMVKDHLISRSSLLGRSEADGYVSVRGNKDAFKEMCAAMNNRRVAVTSQKITDTNIDGLATVMPEWAFAVVCAQTQAGSAIGTPLTNRVIPSTGVTQDVSWTPLADSGELIKAGALIAGADETNTLRIIAGYTSWTGDTNNANIFIETVESLDIFAYNHRKYMQEKFTGVSRYNAQDILNAIDASVKAEIQQTSSVKGWDPKETKLLQTTGGVIRYDLAVIPWEGIVFILPTIIAIREA